MAKLKNGILGGFSGNIGKVQGIQSKGLDIMCQKKSKYVKKETTALTPQRLGYQKCLSIVQSLRYDWDHSFFIDKNNKNSWFNNFFHLNLMELVVHGEFYIPQLVLSVGTLPNCEYEIIFNDGLNWIEFVRRTPVDAYPSFDPSDTVYVCVYDPYTGRLHATNPSIRLVDTFLFNPVSYFPNFSGYLCIYVALISNYGVPFSQFYLLKHFPDL